MRLLKSLGILLGAILLALLVILSEPQWFLSTKTVARAARRFGRLQHPSWRTLDFSIRSLSLRNKEVRLHVEDLCFEDADAGAAGCLKDLEARVTLRLYFFGARLTRISKLLVNGNYLTIDRTKARPGAEPKTAAGSPTLLRYLLSGAFGGLKIEALRVDLPAIEILQADGNIRADLQARFDIAQSLPMTLKLELQQRSGKLSKRYHGEASLGSDLLKGRLDADGLKATFDARVRRQDSETLAVKLDGSAGVWEASGPVKSVQLKAFTAEALFKKDSTDWDRLAFDGRFEVEPASFGDKSERRGLAKTLEGRLQIGARATPKTLETDHFDADIMAMIQPVKDWYEIHGSFQARISGRIGRLSEVKVTHRLDAGLKVAEFAHLVEFLSNTPYAVPAPLYVLKGPVSAAVKGKDGPSGEQTLEYSCVSGLAAGRQALKFALKGTLSASRLWSADRAFKNETTLTVKDVALQTPRLDAKGMAAFTSDDRIDKQPPAGPAAAMDFALAIKTDKPILIRSNLAKDPLPIDLDIHLRRPPGGLTGAVEIRRFRAEIFRRTASIDHITLRGRPDSLVLDLDGLIVYLAGEAKIFIRLLGNTEKPRVELESDPPMAQADIMAMLLFGKSPSDLDSDQQSSVAKAQTAVSNSAFGLASLYLLASTPVEYVGYDPVSQTYTIKFRLPGGATLQVGSVGGNQGVQLRKRLASHLAIQTELTNTQTQGSVVTTFLEWFGRR